MQHDGRGAEHCGAAPSGELTPIHIIAPTGVYKEGFIPAELLDLSVEALAELWMRDLTEGIDGTSSRAGFIKVGLVDDGPTRTGNP